MKNMKIVMLKILFLLCSLMSLNCFANIPADFSLSPMIEKTSPAVVNIRAQIKVMSYDRLSPLDRQKLNPNEIPNAILSIASGVIVDAKKGYILTNAHVIDDAQAVVVTLKDGRHYNAKIIGLDKPSDIALLQINAINLIELPMGNSNNLKVGDFVVAIGNPYGLNQTVSSGIVSALGRAALGIENFENFIQTDASINPGNSGGALLNIKGELVGINTAILAPNQGSVGIGFAIPVNMAKSVMMQLIQFGNVRRGTLGVGAQDVTPDLATALNLKSSDGAVVTLVMVNSPAEQAGLKVGDVITAVDNNIVKNANDVVNAIAFLRVNSTAKLSILRDGKPVSLNIQTTDPKKRLEISEKLDPFLFGVGLKNLNIFSPQHGEIHGVLVLSVLEDTNAWHADLRPNDVIVSVNQQPVTNIDALKKIVASVNAHQELVLHVLRDAGAVFLVINKES